MDFVSMTHVRKKLISNTHVMKTIREEEQLTLPAVKTLVDREYAEATRKKLRQRREQEGTIPKLNLLTKAAKQASKTRAVSQESCCSHCSRSSYVKTSKKEKVQSRHWKVEKRHFLSQWAVQKIRKAENGHRGG
eukprot:05990.XXX_196919_195330_1 [CDS] Oithona nana genome sequencing.